MNLRDCEYLLAVAKTRHFGKAAEQCHVSQSTLSIQIRKLEEFLGVRIFERTSRQVMLTRTGEELCHCAEQIVQQAQRMKKIAAHARDPLAGELHLGAFPTLAPYLFPSVVPLLKSHYPHLRLMLAEEKTETLLKQLEEGTLDCALLALPATHATTLTARELFFEPFSLAVPLTHKFARKRALMAHEVRDEEMLLLEDGHCLRGQVLEFCAQAGAGEARNYRATSLETLRNTVAAGGGITMVPALAIQPGRQDIRYIPFKNPTPGRHIGLVWRASDHRQQLYEAVAALIAESVEL